MEPYEIRYEAATDRALAARKAGHLTEAEFTARMGRLRARRDEQAATYRRLLSLEVADTYRSLTPDQKIRTRLAFRATRPRTEKGT